MALTGGVPLAGGDQQRKLKLEIARRAKAKGFQPKPEANIGPAVNLPLEKHMPPGEWTAQSPHTLAATGESAAAVLMRVLLWGLCCAGYQPPFWTRPGPNSDSASGFAFFV